MPAYSGWPYPLRLHCRHSSSAASPPLQMTAATGSVDTRFVTLFQGLTLVHFTARLEPCLTQ